MKDGGYYDLLTALLERLAERQGISPFRVRTEEMLLLEIAAKMKKNRNIAAKEILFEIFKIRSDFFFRKRFSDTGISIEGNSFLKYLKYFKCFSFSEKDFPNIIEETHRNERKGFSLKRGGGSFYAENNGKHRKYSKKRKGKKDNFFCKENGQANILINIFCI